ncbi:mucin-2-like isoform X2 [Sycon ciliatum]|uniref:mucin-2-like isoform X2 n=1 Tax=Sycon ciliatum TaxID=27933 RepID=UPI0031F61E5E
MIRLSLSALLFLSLAKISLGQVCPHTPPIVVNGSYTSQTTPIQLLGTIMWSCNQGSLLSGPISQTCTAEGFQSNPPGTPVCVYHDCKKLPVPSNGTVEYNRTDLGATAFYYCHPGYQRIGVLERRCIIQAGQAGLARWSDSATTCDDVEECVMSLDNCNSHASCTNTIGSFTCACHPGFTGNGVNCTSTATAPPTPPPVSTQPVPSDAPTTPPVQTNAPTTPPVQTNAPTTPAVPPTTPPTPSTPSSAPPTPPVPSSAPTTPPTPSTPSSAPTTPPVLTNAPTIPPAPTNAPTIPPVPTSGPTTPAPTTRPPTAPSPTTRGPTTPAPTTRGPTTPAPTTRGPTTPAPTTRGPTTPAPTMRGPTTPAPTTRGPTTAAPTTRGPTTPAPTTRGPTTAAPTTRGPTTPAPTTRGPTTPAPTTRGPTTPAPTMRATTTPALPTPAPTTQEPTTLRVPTTQASTTQAVPTQPPPTTEEPMSGSGDVPTCQSTTCKNGGTCTDGIGIGLTCTCVPGFKGMFCGEGVTCSDPNTPNTTIANLHSRSPSINSSGSYSYNARLSYYCLEGFNLNGTAARRCQANGAWSADEPTCVGTARVYGSWLSLHQELIQSLQQETAAGMVPNSTAQVIDVDDTVTIYHVQFWQEALDSWLMTTNKWREVMLSRGFNIPAVPALVNDSSANVHARWQASVEYAGMLTDLWYTEATTGANQLSAVSPTAGTAAAQTDAIYTEDLYQKLAKNLPTLITNYKESAAGPTPAAPVSTAPLGE